MRRTAYEAKSTLRDIDKNDDEWTLYDLEKKKISHRVIVRSMNDRIYIFAPNDRRMKNGTFAVQTRAKRFFNDTPRDDHTN